MEEFNSKQAQSKHVEQSGVRLYISLLRHT
jgi:hypothetical protein